MGCGGSVSKKQVVEELKKTEAELLEERRRMQDKDAQIASVRESLQEQLQGSTEADASRSVQELREELEARRRQHQQELEEQRLALEQEHQAELQALAQEREAAVQLVAGEGSPKHQDARARRAAAERSHEMLMERLRDMAQAEAVRHRTEAEAAEREIAALGEQMRPLRAERAEASEALQNVRHLLRAEMLERTGANSQTANLERQLADAQEEHVRSEQKYADLAQHLRAQMRDLQAELRQRTEELWQRNGLLLQKDQDLMEMNCQLADLQSLFDEVNHQLQKECTRIEKLQDTVSQCARQKQEVEQLEAMVEDSHKMIAQVRDALEQERAERVKAAGQLEAEQQRTQLLLEVLKHFKEKLQGLTPQMILSRLGSADSKLLLGRLSSTDSKLGATRTLAETEWISQSPRVLSPARMVSPPRMASPPRLVKSSSLKEMKEVPFNARPVVAVPAYREPVASRPMVS